MRKNARYAPGFTLVELLVTVAIIAILASVVVPLSDVAVRHGKERELRDDLRQIREAIDAYKRAADRGEIAKNLDESGYPKTLRALYEGVDNLKDPKRSKQYFLRKLPRDPMSLDDAADPESTWGKRSYASGPTDPQEGEDVFDVYSRSDETGLNGVPYREW